MLWSPIPLGAYSSLVVNSVLRVKDTPKINSKHANVNRKEKTSALESFLNLFFHFQIIKFTLITFKTNSVHQKSTFKT